MKKIIFIMLILSIPVMLFSQKRHMGYCIKEADSTDCTWEHVTTEACTSTWHLSYPVMTIYGSVYKWQSTADAPDLDLTFQTTNSGKDIPSSDLTWTVADTFEWKITMTAIGSGMYYRLISTGGAANDSTKAEFYFDGFPEE